MKVYIVSEEIGTKLEEALRSLKLLKTWYENTSDDDPIYKTKAKRIEEIQSSIESIISQLEKKL